MMCNAVVALLAAGILYVFIRKDPFVDILEQSFSMVRQIRAVIYHPLENKSFLCLLVKNQLGDMLWAYSLGCALIVSTGDEKRAVKKAAILIVVAEFMQLLPFAKATFDFLDILVELLGVVIAYFVARYKYSVAYGDYYDKCIYEKKNFPITTNFQMNIH